MKKLLAVALSLGAVASLAACSSNAPSSIDDVLDFLQAESQTAIYDNYSMVTKSELMNMIVEIDGDVTYSEVSFGGMVEKSYVQSTKTQVITYSEDLNGKWEKTTDDVVADSDTDADVESGLEYVLLTSADFDVENGVYTCNYEKDDSMFTKGDTIDMSKDGEFVLDSEGLVVTFSNFGDVSLTLPTVGELVTPEVNDDSTDSVE